MKSIRIVWQESATMSSIPRKLRCEKLCVNTDFVNNFHGILKWSIIFLDPNDVAKIYAEADKLIGEHCHWSLHCGGIIVYDDKGEKGYSQRQSNQTHKI